MRILVFGEYAVIGLGILLFLTQVIVPAIMGFPLFPLFRTRRRIETAIARERERIFTEQKLGTLREIKSQKFTPEAPPSKSEESEPEQQSKPQPKPTVRKKSK